MLKGALVGTPAFTWINVPVVPSAYLIFPTQKGFLTNCGGRPPFAACGIMFA